MPETAAETACFEAGIKFGALYHQFAGTPVTPASAPSLETAIAEAIENQPFCTTVTVDIDPERVREAANAGPGEGAYAELTGALMDVELVVERADTRVRAVMQTEDGYPKMQLANVEHPDA